MSGRLQLGRDELNVSRQAPRTIVRHICDPEYVHPKPPNDSSGQNVYQDSQVAL